MIHKKLLVVFFMALLILLSLFPRSIEVLNGNPLFEIDQGRDYMAVKNIVVDHKLTLIGAELGAGQAGLSYLFHGPGYFYLLSIPFIFFNGNPVGGVALMLLLGLSAIAFGVYFVIKFWGIKEGLLMGFLLATCPYLIGQSRFFENHFGAPIFILIVFYFTYLFTKKPVKNYLFVFLAGLVSAFIYNLELAISVPLSISLIVYCVYLFRKQALPRLLLLMAGLAIGFSPMFLFELRHGFMGLKHLFTYLLLRPQTHTSSESMLSQAQNIYNLFILSFSDSFPGKLLAPQHIVPFIFLVFLTLIIFVLFKEKDKTKKNFLVFLLILFPVNF